MATSEWVLILMPIIWLCVETLMGRQNFLRKIALKWLLLLVASLIFSYFWVSRLSDMLGGRWTWGEVIYYAWLLSAFFSVLQIFKIVLDGVLKKFIRWPTHEVSRRIIQKVIYYVILFVSAIPFFLAMTSIHRVKIGDGHTPKTAWGFEYEDVSLKTSDGLHIKGWFVPAASDKAVIIAHGLSANKSNFLGTVEMWHELGLNVLIFDFRGHGMSEGHTVTFGYEERRDIMAAAEYLLKEKKFTSDKIIGYGVSFGGAAMIQAAKEMPIFHKLIIDSSFANLGDMADMIVDGEVIIPSFCRKAFKEIGLFFVRLDLGFDIREKSPENAIGGIAGTPILLIHGKGDPMINWRQTERLFERAKDPKQVVFLETQGHFGTPNDPAYRDIIRTFIENK
ncbi:MAG: alpha/beta hydrolase [Candidatus Omnitrophica bacterium]|nr:alpha/beta hydrolase [Candidatus Omnitrophota bacterium]